MSTSGKGASPPLRLPSRLESTKAWTVAVRSFLAWPPGAMALHPARNPQQSSRNRQDFRIDTLIPHRQSTQTALFPEDSVRHPMVTPIGSNVAAARRGLSQDGCQKDKCPPRTRIRPLPNPQKDRKYRGGSIEVHHPLLHCTLIGCWRRIAQQHNCQSDQKLDSGQGVDGP